MRHFAIFGFLLLAFLPFSGFAQTLPSSVDQTEVDKRLRARGFDPSNAKAEDLPKIQSATQEIILEIEKEKAAASSSNVIVKDSSNIQKISETAPDVVTQVQKAEKVKANIATVDALDEVETVVKGAAKLDSLPPSSIFGQSIFRDRKLEVYRQTSEINTPDSYELGPGDKLAISIWGIAVFNGAYEINKEGFIQPQGLSRIFLKGKTFAQAKAQLESEFARRYPVSQGNFDVTLVASRTLSINVTGEVFNYGTYRLLALNSAFNALVVAGGPTDIGSVRNIQLIRANGKRERIDVYEYLLNPSASKNMTLEDGDNLFIPVVERLVSVTGAINRSSVYELIKGENLTRLIELAGGLKADAFSKNLQVRRYLGDKETLINVDLEALKKAGQDFELLNGDRVSIGTVPISIENFVNITGAVYSSNSYELTAGMRISDLVKKAILQQEAQTDYAWLLRENRNGTFKSIKIDLAAALADPSSAANFLLLPKDQLQIFPKSKYTDAFRVQISGAVRQPGSFPFDPARSQKVSDLITLAGGLRENAFEVAYVLRTLPNNAKERQYLKFNIRKAAENPAAADNLALREGDVIRVFSNEFFLTDAEISVQGAVRQPGRFRWDPTLRLEDVLLQSGGLKPEAASNRVEIFRLEISENEPTKTVVANFQIDRSLKVLNADGFELEPFDIIVVRTVPDFELQKIININGEVAFPGPYAITTANERITDLLKKAGGLTPEAFPEGATLFRVEDRAGFMVFELDEVLRRPSSPDNFVLKAGDVINVPKVKDFVSIKGATRAPEVYQSKVLNNGTLNVAFRPGKKALFYINEYAAGFAENGSRRRVLVEDPNGRIRRTKNFGLFKIYPKVEKGAIIIVGTKPPKKPKTDAPKFEEEQTKLDWEAIAAKTLASATSVLTLILLIKAVK